MYVYRTTSFNDELKRNQNLASRVDAICSDTEKKNLASIETSFKRIHGYRKRKIGRQFRIIGKVIRVAGEPILCLLKVYSRGEPEYRVFLERVKHKNNLFQESDLVAEIRVWLEQQRYSSALVMPNKIDDSLRVWLEKPQWSFTRNEIIIYESIFWSQQFAKEEFQDSLLEYRQLIEELVINYGRLGTETEVDLVRVYNRGDFNVIFSNFTIKDNFQEEVLFLIAPLSSTKKDIKSAIPSVVNTAVSQNWWRKYQNFLLDDLINETKRSYPGYLVLDEEIWLQIQDGDRVNLTLSQEEKNLLVDSSLPLFLNGRAGSGKSTMLFYLFARYCHLYLQLTQRENQTFKNKFHPLFLTYSPSLSDFARVKVQSILKHHHYFISERDSFDKISQINTFFQPLRSFLLSLLPGSIRANFTKDKHISFHVFRELLQNKYPKLSPEKCWLTIQTFIKGYELTDLDSYLDSVEKYQNIPKKERIVSVEDFIDIRDRVWSWYLKYTQKNQLWDDRDLVRTILALDCYEPNYTVIFCDEAQDFTRLELQLIMRLSIFSLYNLDREGDLSLPFAFAGDPLQTLNPSGFSWTGFKAAFHNEVLTPLGLNNRKQNKLNLEELKYNYRSAASIVKVNNLIQLWRRNFFELEGIKPQKAKKQNSFIPQKLILKPDTNFQELSEILKETIILIPCDEGAEAEFIQKDNFLKLFTPKKERDIKTPWNILSAISAKGLEFPQVVIYGFGKACKLHLKDFTQSQENQYFLNKLYVAASRATEKLLIIDSLEGEIRLWSYASDREFIDSLVIKAEAEGKARQWQENIELITNSTTLIDFGAEDPEILAAKFAAVGKEGNINFLNRAIEIYRGTNNQKKADTCLAVGAKLEGKFLEAGKLFAKLNQPLEAAECFWQARNWQRLQSIVVALPRSQNSEIDRFQTLLPIINFMVETSSVIKEGCLQTIAKKILSIADILELEIAQPKLLQKRSESPWQEFIDNYLKCLHNLSCSPHTLENFDWLKISQILINYQGISDREYSPLILKILYLSRDYATLIAYWEEGELEIIKNDFPESKYYYLAKAQIAKFPESLKYLSQGKLYKHILQLWINQGKPLNLIWLEYVAAAFANLGNYHNAIVLYCQLNRPKEVENYLQKIDCRTLNKQQTKKLLSYYLRQQLWDEALTFALLKFESLQLKCNFVYCLASSKLTPSNILPQQRQKYQKFITSEIIQNKKWQQYLTISQLGIALEKIGAFNLTLNFYQQYLNYRDPQIQRFTRDRWIANKQNQILYFQATSKLAKANQSQQSLIAKATKWHLDPNSISLQPPSLKQLRNNRHTLLPSRQVPNHPQILGLPKEAKIQTLPQKILQIEIQDLVLRIAEATSKLAIINLKSQKHLILDWRRGKVKLDTNILVASGDKPLLFADTSGQYRAILWREKNPRLELKLDSYSQKIILKFGD